MTLMQAVDGFLRAHDQFFTYSGWKIDYYSERDKAAHIEEQKAVAVLREAFAKATDQSQEGRKAE